MSFPVYSPTVGRKKTKKEGEDLLSELYRQIGQLKVELEWVKKRPKCSS